MQDLNAMIDAAKYADLVLLLVDGAFGFEMETFEFLNILQVSPFYAHCDEGVAILIFFAQQASNRQPQFLYWYLVRGAWYATSECRLRH